MNSVLLFPFADYWWLYAAFIALVIVILLLDLGVFHKDAHIVGFKEAAGWSVFWIGLAMAFNYGFYEYAYYTFHNTRPDLLAIPGFDPAAAAKQVGLEFLTGFVVEKSLAVDNLFVFLVVFSYFGIPAKYQHRVLFYGILGALIFRAIFIAIGSVLMQYHAVILFFGAFLIFTGVKMLFASEKPIEPDKNPFIRLLRKFVPVTGEFHGQSFWVKLSGKWHATPLFIALVFLELTDIVFAVDSVPAIFALTKEPLIVFTSNIFAILGLRAMFFLLAGIMDKFHYLKIGLAFVLVFVGLKMVWLNEAFGGKFPISWSLGIIGAILLASVLGSLLFPKKEVDVDPALKKDD